MAIPLPQSVMEALTKEEQWERMKAYLDTLSDDELWECVGWDEEGVNDFFLPLVEESLAKVWRDEEVWDNC